MRRLVRRAPALDRAAAAVVVAAVGALMIVALPVFGLGDGRGPKQATSLLGKPLHALLHPPGLDISDPGLDPINQAVEFAEQNPDDPESAVGLAVAAAARWRYLDALRYLDTGIEKYPAYAPLYRHRGHRRISLRQFETAETDLERAASLDASDFDIWYHLGLARYLQGDFEGAGNAYQESYRLADDDDSRVAAGYWLFLSLRRDGQEEAASRLLASFSADMNVLQNVWYHRLLQVFQGKVTAEEVVEEATGDLDLATAGYGAGLWFQLAGETERAREVFERIVAVPWWPAFGFIAAEVELARTLETPAP